MRQFLWRIVAHIITIPAVTDWVIRRAQRTPYTPITKRQGTDLYMGRWWLFNAYSKDATGEPGPARWPWLPSVRVHHIVRADDDPHFHDHPWNARTIVLRGWYLEERPGWMAAAGSVDEWSRCEGYTGRLLFGEYHRISRVPDEGVWTLFFTWSKRGTWGFLVDGAKVPWRKYLGLESA